MSEGERDALQTAADLRRIADHISETLYYAGSAIDKAYSRAAERCIRHDDYDRLRAIAADTERTDNTTRLEHLDWQEGRTPPPSADVDAALMPLQAWLDEQEWMPTSAAESILIFARAAIRAESEAKFRGAMKVAEAADADLDRAEAKVAALREAALEYLDAEDAIGTVDARRLDPLAKALRRRDNAQAALRAALAATEVETEIPLHLPRRSP